LPVEAFAQHAIETVIQMGDHPRQVGGVVLKVAVHRGEDVPFRVVEPGLHGRGLPEVPAQPHELDAGIVVRQFLDFEVGAVDAAVVHQHRFPRAGVGEGVAQPLNQRTHVGAFVLHRHHDGQQTHAPPRTHPTVNSAARDSSPNFTKEFVRKGIPAPVALCNSTITR
jgi:hypothetical protein